MKELRQTVDFIRLEDQTWWDAVEQYITSMQQSDVYDLLESLYNIDDHKEKIRLYLLQKPVRNMFERPEEPLREDWTILWQTKRKEWQNWQPVFLDWDNEGFTSDEIDLNRYGTIDEFILDIIKEKIPLFWNPEHPEVRKLIYPDWN